MKFSKRIWLQYWKAILPLGRGTALLKETFTHLLFSYSPLTWYRWASLWERQWSHLRAWAERCWHSPATCSWEKLQAFGWYWSLFYIFDLVWQIWRVDIQILLPIFWYLILKDRYMCSLYFYLQLCFLYSAWKSMGPMSGWGYSSLCVFNDNITVSWFWGKCYTAELNRFSVTTDICATARLGSHGLGKLRSQK